MKGKKSPKNTSLPDDEVYQPDFLIITMLTKTHNSFFIWFLILFIPGYIPLSGQSGCTDPQALNYSSSAKKNDGSCLYPVTHLKPKFRAKLPSMQKECSGLAFFNNGLWAILDSGNPARLYALDTSNATVLKSYKVPSTDNTDWEDIAQDSLFLYIGDFGNNEGNRKDLRIIRISKAGLAAGNPIPEFISFTFSDQIVFEARPNYHNHDCEGFFHFRDSLHLFSKNWIDGKTRHYVLPTIPGVYKAQLRDSFNVEGLVTAATASENGNVLLLCFNPVSDESFLWWFNGYEGSRFFSGNKRKLILGSVGHLGRPEGIDFRNQYYGYICSESDNTAAPQLLTFEIGQWMQVVSNLKETELRAELLVYPNPFKSSLHVVLPEPKKGKINIEIWNALTGISRKIVETEANNLGYFTLNFENGQMPPGMYILKIETDSDIWFRKILWHDRYSH